MSRMKVDAFQCSVCGKLYHFQSDAIEHEKKCQEEKDEDEKAQNAYQVEMDEARAEAIALAEKDEPLRLLLANGHLEAARNIAHALYHDNISFDADCSSWFEETYIAMMKAALAKLEAKS